MVAIDLHSHSSASDGSCSPEELVSEAAAAGVRVLALTDHDTVTGIPAALSSAEPLGLRLIPGVELSVTWEGRSLHVVGLGIDPTSPSLNEGLTRLGAARDERAAAMVDRLARGGAPIAGVLDRRRGLTRTHLAKALVDAGHSRDLRQAFQRWLARGRPGYVAGRWAGLGEAVGWIRAAGGTAVLAHPLRYGLSGSWMRRLLVAFRDFGGEGLEVASGQGGPTEVATAAGHARRYGLLASAGSDFHGPDQPWLQLGRLPPLPGDLKTVWEARGWAA